MLAHCIMTPVEVSCPLDCQHDPDHAGTSQLSEFVVLKGLMQACALHHDTIRGVVPARLAALQHDTSRGVVSAGLAA